MLSSCRKTSTEPSAETPQPLDDGIDDGMAHRPTTWLGPQLIHQWQRINLEREAMEEGDLAPLEFASKSFLLLTRGHMLRQSTRPQSHAEEESCAIIESFRFWDENDYEYEIFSVLSSARAWTNVILAGKCDSRRHSTTSFSENVIAGTIWKFNHYATGKGLNHLQ